MGPESEPLSIGQSNDCDHAYALVLVELGPRTAACMMTGWLIRLAQAWWVS